MKITEKFKQNKGLGILAVLLIIAIFLTWNFLSHSPSGCYAKAFLIGSSVCHQIPSHSFSVGTVQFPVCARCTGLYIGSFIGIVYAFLSGKKIAMPKKKFILFLAKKDFLFLKDKSKEFSTNKVLQILVLNVEVKEHM